MFCPTLALAALSASSSSSSSSMRAWNKKSHSYTLEMHCILPVAYINSKLFNLIGIKKSKDNNLVHRIMP